MTVAPCYLHRAEAHDCALRKVMGLWSVCRGAASRRLDGPRCDRVHDRMARAEGPGSSVTRPEPRGVDRRPDGQGTDHDRPRRTDMKLLRSAIVAGIAKKVIDEARK